MSTYDPPKALQADPCPTRLKWPLKQQYIDSAIEFRRRAVQQEEMHAAFERATDRKQTEELRRAWWDYATAPMDPKPLGSQSDRKGRTIWRSRRHGTAGGR